jgi:F-box/leucine-rich repeat protein 10/11
MEVVEGKRNRRARPRIDYAALNESHTIQELNVHPHIAQFNNFNDKFQVSGTKLSDLVCLIDDIEGVETKFYNEEGQFNDESLKKLIHDTKLIKPILIRGANPNVKETYNPRIKIDFHIPCYDIGEVTDKIGQEHKVPVMDVMTQNNSPRWDMKRWRDYFKQNKEERDRIRNVISLEISDTELGEEVRVPKVVTDLDIVLKLFDQDNENRTLSSLLEENDVLPPKVQKYILMSIAGSYTDFHIDFAGTSVYYSPMCGRKQFILIPPTPSNIDVYKKWCLSDDQNKVWFPSLLKPITAKDNARLRNDGVPREYINNGMVIDIFPGDLLLLPSMWIHAVYTLEDSLIIGGNYLNLLSLENHLKTYQVEVATRVNDQFKFPNFVKFVWLIAYYLQSSESTENMTDFQRKCYSNLVVFLKDQWKFVRGKHSLKREKLAVTKLRASIPKDIIGDVDQFLATLDTWMTPQLEGSAEDDAPPAKRPKVE